MATTQQIAEYLVESSPSQFDTDEDPDRLVPSAHAGIGLPSATC